METLRTAIWNALLDAEMNVRYWRCLARKDVLTEKALKIVLALTSSGAFLAIWASNPGVVKVLSAISTILAISLPILNLSERVETMAGLCGKWTQMSIEYDRLWLRSNSEPQGNYETEIRLLKERTIELRTVEAKLPYDNKLIQRCQREVLMARGIIRSIS
jgi:hypothetical protein